MNGRLAGGILGACWAAGCGGAETPPAAPPPPAVAPAPQAPPAVQPPPPPPTALWSPALATATIRFRAKASGPLPKMRAIRFDRDPKCGGLNAGEVPRQDVVADAEGRLANVIVHATRGPERWTYPPAAEPVVMDQKGCMYVPHVLTVAVRQPITVLNSDPTVHNVHAIPSVHPADEFNRTQQPGGGALTMRFTRPEIAVRLTCDVHVWMDARIGVFPHPFHGVTGADGTVEVKVPPGTFEFTAWHEYEDWEARPAPQSVTVAAGGTKEIEFEFRAK